MPWIENISARDVSIGLHKDPGPNAMLIQIMDPAAWFPDPKHKFKEVHQFEFLDIDDWDLAKNPNLEKAAIQPEQAKRLVQLLRHALKHNMNVVVHCFMGMCRSGAVAEIGQKMGFELIDNFREPNTRVLDLMKDQFKKKKS